MKKIILNGQNVLHFICPSEIISCKSDDCYTTVSLKSTDQIVICRSLTQFSTELDENVFVRINQSYLVNKHMVRKIIKKGKYVEMMDGGRIPFTKTIKELLSLLS